MPASQHALDLIEQVTGHVNTIVNDPPEIGRPLSPLLIWIFSVVSAILTSMVETIKSLDTRLIELEEASSSESEAANQANIDRARFLGIPPPQPQPPQPSTQHAAPASTQGSRPPRCTQCHARGHTVANCRTANPSAMRQQVARNSRIAREARSTRNIPAPTPLSPAPVYAYQPPLAPVAPVPMAYAALAADTTELRRRAAQSARDKRLRQRRTAVAATTPSS
ncbi:hypothetical protein DXG01_010520 [Tephrocybe rancida]|nr:hypothetical protein DXG01_010520 [Tephrocybe rancida]